jgi:hypothetical protein
MFDGTVFLEGEGGNFLQEKSIILYLLFHYNG